MNIIAKQMLKRETKPPPVLTGITQVYPFMINLAKPIISKHYTHMKTYMRSGLKRCIIAHKARPLLHEVVRSVTLTFLYPSVCF